MPEPAATSDPNTIPGGDIPFDQLFGNDPDTSSTAGPANPTAATQTTTTAQPAAASPTQPTTPTWELRNSDGTINYRSPEAAIQGIEHKDTIIQQLRDKYKAVTGQDPLKPQPVEPQQVSYLQDPNKFAEDLAAAAKEGNAQKYTQTQIKLFDEYLGPVKPLIQEFARTRAQAQVTSEIKEFEPFRISEDFKKTLERNPALANAIQGAEANPQYYGQLPELYRLAYQSHVASRVPELVQAAQQAAATQTARPTQTTTTTSTLAPGAPTTNQSDQELLRSKEGRAEIKKRFESSGILDRDWSTLRW